MPSIAARMCELAWAAITDSVAFGPQVPGRHVQLFPVGQAVSGCLPAGGIRETLMADTGATIDAMVADDHAAAEYVHLLFGVRLPDMRTTSCSAILPSRSKYFRGNRPSSLNPIPLPRAGSRARVGTTAFGNIPSRCLAPSFEPEHRSLP